jgi:hypothetical protein
MLGWDRCSFHKKPVRTRYAQLVFLHLVGSAGHVVHSSGSGAQTFDAPFFILGWAQCGSIKSILGHVMPNLCFCIQWDLWVT